MQTTRFRAPMRVGGLFSDRQDLRVLLATMVVSAGAIHLAVTPVHFSEYVGFGVFFAVAAVLQFWAGWRCIKRPTARLLVVTAILSLVVVGVWLVSRTVGIPFGPDGGRAERIGLADVVATLYEVGAAVVALILASDAAALGRRLRVSARASTVATLLGWVTVGAMVTGH